MEFSVKLLLYLYELNFVSDGRILFTQYVHVYIFSKIMLVIYIFIFNYILFCFLFMHCDLISVYLIIKFFPQAKVLIACDSLEGNPVEIRKASEKSDASPDSQSSRFHSCLPKASIEKPELEVQPYIPATPIKFCGEWRNGKDSIEHTPSRLTIFFYWLCLSLLILNNHEIEQVTF